jgi:hypothetical protein
MSVPPALSPASFSTSGFEDGLGRRTLMFDRETGGILECLHLRPELAGFERAIRDRMERAAGFDDERFARPRSVERDSHGAGVIVVSEYVSGNRLSDVLEGLRTHGLDDVQAPGVDAALGFLAQALAALTALHAAAGFPHGVVGPGRTVVTPSGEVVLLDWIFGNTLDRLRLGPVRFWRELGVAAPTVAGANVISAAGDVAQSALTALMIVLGRPLRASEYPGELPALVLEVVDIAQIQLSARCATGLERFLHRALPVSGGRPYATADEAVAALTPVVEEVGSSRCRSAFATLVAEFNGLRDGEETAGDQRKAAISMAPPAFVEPDEPRVEHPAPRPAAGGAQPLTTSDATEFEIPLDLALAEALGIPPAIEPEPAAYELSLPTPAAMNVFAPVVQREIEPAVQPPVSQAPASVTKDADLPAVDDLEVTPPAQHSDVRIPADLKASEPDAVTIDAPPPAVVSVQTPAAAPVAPAVAPAPAAAAVPVPAVAQPENPPKPVLQAPEPRGEVTVAAPAPMPPPIKAPPAPVAPVRAAAAKPAARQRRRGAKGDRDKLRSIAKPVPAVPAPPAPVPVPRPAPRPPIAPAAMPYYPPVFDPREAAPSPGAARTAPVPQPAVAPAPIQLKPAQAPIQLKPVPIAGAVRLKNEAPAGYAPPPRRGIYDTGDVSPLPSLERTAPRRSSSLYWKLGAVAALVAAVGAGAIARPYLIDQPRAAALAKVLPAPATPKAVTTGSLVLVSEPAGARVLVDGTAAGETPVTIDAVAPGRHTITFITASGSVRKTVRIEAGKTVSLDVPVYSGSLAVFAPIPLDISENGRSIGSTEQGRVMLSPGRHQVTFSNRELGYSATQAVEVEAGEERSINVQPTGEVNLNALPWAEVWIDGTKKGDTPIASLRVPLGTHQIVFKHPQFGDRTLTVVVHANAPNPATVDFTKAR